MENLWNGLVRSRSEAQRLSRKRVPNFLIINCQTFPNKNHYKFSSNNSITKLNIAVINSRKVKPIPTLIQSRLLPFLKINLKQPTNLDLTFFPHSAKKLKLKLKLKTVA
jgi:hypothetical protein